jgi:membrane protein involved in colicin uptake
VSPTEEDVRRAAEMFDADLASRGMATFTSEQIAEFQSLANEPDVIERARRCHAMGEKILREAEESRRRYEEVRKQAEELGIDLNMEWDGDAMRARRQAAEAYAERAKQEVESEARRLFGGGAAASEESAARVLSRGVGRMRV